MKDASMMKCPILLTESWAPTPTLPVAVLGLWLAMSFGRELSADEPFKKGEVSFSSHVAQLVFDNCTSCHRPGQSGPFSLITYSDVAQRAETISAVVRDRYMPPWKPVHSGIEYSNDRRLDENERAILERWIAAGCPQGDPQKLPPPPEYPDGWSLGRPDLVIKMEEPFKIPASGPDLYRSFVFPINLTEDRWIKAIELRPQARAAVHHAIFFASIASDANRPKERDGQPGFRGMNFLSGSGNEMLKNAPDRLAGGLGGYVPGATPNPLPGDLARFLPRGSNIVMQTHFHPTGKPETEQAELGIYFTNVVPTHRLIPIQVPAVFGLGVGIHIPAGEKNYRVSDSVTLPTDVLAHEIGGHAHYLCRQMEMLAQLPNGKRLTLLKIDDWDLDWQDQYAFSTPVELPKGTRIDTTIIYDNSPDNAENPFSPPRDISWGRESTDEMGSVTLNVTAVDERQRTRLEELMRDRSQAAIMARIKSQAGMFGALGGGGRLNGGMLKLLDRNRDGKLQEGELPDKFRDRLMEFMDKNYDNELDAAELEEARDALQKLTDRSQRIGGRKQ